MVAGTEAAEQAYADRLAAQAAVDAADDRFRAAVGELVAVEQSLEDIAELTGVPIGEVRAARRPKKGGEDDGGEQTAPGVVPPAVPNRPRRQVAVGKPSTAPPVPDFLRDQPGDVKPGEEPPGSERLAPTG